jgi:hypothetical protein
MPRKQRFKPTRKPQNYPTSTSTDDRNEPIDERLIGTAIPIETESQDTGKRQSE